MSFFDDEYDDAEPSRDGRYMEAGVYDVKVKKVIQRLSRVKVPGFIVELEIIASNNPSFPLGSIMTWYQSVKNGTDQAKMAKGEIKKFVDCCFGVPTESKFGEFAVSDEQPLAGTILHVVAIDKPTLKGGSFTKPTWTLIEMSPRVKSQAA